MAIELTMPWPRQIGGEPEPAGKKIYDLHPKDEDALCMLGTARRIDGPSGTERLLPPEPPVNRPHPIKPKEAPAKKPAAAPGRPDSDDERKMALREEIIALGGEVPALDKPLADFEAAVAAAQKDDPKPGRKARK